MSSSHPSTSSAETSERVREQTAPSIAMRVYSLFWWTGFAIFTCAMFAVTLALSPLLLFDRRQRIFHVMTTCVWGWGVYKFNPFWSLRVEGRDKLPWDGRAVYIPNHDSLADILVLGALFRPFKFVSKASILSVPVLGWGMRLLRYITVVRGNRESVLRMFERCRETLDEGVPIVIFPEGTRSPDGGVLPFKPGAFQLAVETESPVYPIVLGGTRDALPKHGLIAPLRSEVRVRVLDPVDPAPFGDDHEALSSHVRTIIMREKTKLLQEMGRVD